MSSRHYIPRDTRKVLFLFVTSVSVFLSCLTSSAAFVHEKHPDFTPEERAILNKHPVLKVQCAENWAPYNFSEAGKAKGYVNDYLRLLEEKLGIRFEFVMGHSWSDYLQMLRTGEIDLISNMVKTPDRKKQFRFSSQPVFDVIDGLLTTKENSKLADLENLQGKTLAVARNYSHQELLERYYPDIPLLLTDDLLDSIKQVIAGNAVAAIGSHAVFNFLATQHLLSDVRSIPIHNNTIFPPSSHYLAVASDNQNLMDVLDHGMGLITDSELHSLRSKWIHRDDGSPQDAVLTFSRREQAYLDRKKEITMCVDPDWLPLEKIEDSKHIGMAADYIHLLEEQIGIPITLVPTRSWSESMEYAKARKCDIYSLAMSTPERRGYMFFTEPYLKIPLVLAARTNSPFVADITALATKKLGVVKGYAFGELLRSKYPNMQIVDVPSLNEGLQMVVNKELYGCIGTLATIGYSIQRNFTGELKVAGKFDEQWELGVATRNDEPELLAIFNNAIKQLDKDTQQQILNKWISVVMEKGMDYTLLRRVLTVVSVLILFLLFRAYTLGRYNRRLKKQNGEIIRQAELLKETQTALLLTQQAVDSCAFPICWLRSHKKLEHTTLIHVNQAAADLLGYSQEELLQSPIKCFDKNQSQEAWEHMQQTLKQKQSLSRQAVFTRKNGSTFPVEIFINAFTYEKDSFHFIFFTDVSKEREIEKQLHRSMKMEAIGTMAGGVAHDLNNILSGVVSYPELLLMKLAPDSELRKPLETIRQAGIRAADVVADMLTVTRGVAAAKEPANLNTIINEYIDSPECRQIIHQHPGITCTKHLNPELLNISCSQVHIRKCLMNLITNAIEAIDDIGEITISTDNFYIDTPTAGRQFLPRGEYVMLSISDNGRGIPEKFIPHIFEPFYTKKIMGKSGTGLGLSVVWNTVQDHNGTIHVESNDTGSTFILHFPVSRLELAAELQEQFTETIQGDEEHILVVDDESQQRDICQQMLTALNYRVDTVKSGEEALDFLDSQAVDLLVLDMIMDPGLDGLETYEQALVKYPGQKAVIVSGYSQSANVAKAQALGAGKFVRKPYSLHQLGQAVKEALA